MKKVLQIVTLVLFCTSLQAQSEYTQFWTGAGVVKNFNKQWRIAGDVQFRFNQDGFPPQRNYVQLRGAYTPIEMYRVGVNYRFTNWGFTNTHRIDIDNYFRYSWEKEHFDLRLRLQRKFGFQTNIEDRIRLRFRYRHRFDKRIAVYGKAEYFYTISYNFNDFEKQRYTVGCKFRVALGHFIDAFWRYESFHNQEFPERRYILGLLYTYKFRN